MSLKAMTWVWEHSPAAGTELLVLLAIADNADDTGANAYPSTDTLARKTRLDTRTVQRVIRRLADRGLVVVDRGGGRAANRYSIPLTTPQRPGDNPPHPVNRPPGSVDKPPDSGDGSPTPPAECHRWQNATGGAGATAGVAQLRHRRGDTATPPEPSSNRPRTTTTRARGPTAAAGHTPTTAGSGGQPVEDVFDALGPAWALSPAQRARLADLPPPLEAPRLARPAWCGGCQEHTRQRETDTGTPYRCPTCHPLEVVVTVDPAPRTKSRRLGGSGTPGDRALKTGALSPWETTP